MKNYLAGKAEAGPQKAVPRPAENGRAAATPGAKLRPPQLDGNQTTAPAKPTRAPLQDRRASPNDYSTSGMERGMAALADKMHPPKRR